MKQCVKALPKTGNCFKYLCKMFPHLSKAKLKEGVFDSPDVRELIFDEDVQMHTPPNRKQPYRHIYYKIISTLATQENDSCL
jgi:hypothetical protein